MLLAQVIIGIIAGGVAGFLANLLGPQVELGLPEGFTVGIVGALAGSWLLNVLEIVSGADIASSLSTAIIGAVILLVVFAAAKLGWRWSHMFRKKPVWSFVQPFEE